MRHQYSLGNAAPQREVLPSSESVQAAIRGEPGAVAKVFVSTALRSLFIMPGMAIVGVRGGRLIAGSLLSSATITAMLFLFYRPSMMREAAAALGDGAANPDPILDSATQGVTNTLNTALDNAAAAAPGFQGLRGGDGRPRSRVGVDPFRL